MEILSKPVIKNFAKVNNPHRKRSGCRICDVCGKQLPNSFEALSCDKCKHFTSYIINFSVDVPTGMCLVLTSEIDENGKCKTYTFPITKRYDREALTQLLYAASMQFNTDYVSEDHVYNLVSNAIDSIYWSMRKHGIRKLRPREVVAQG
jgi:hypothetical protein